MVFNSENVSKIKRETTDTYLKLFDSVVKPTILKACECLGDALKDDTFANKIKKFYLRILKYILGVNEKVNNIKVLAEVAQFPLSINIEKQMIKYLQSFTFIDKDKYISKAFQEDNLDTAGWIRNIKNIL